MPPRRATALVAAVVALAILQILYEDVLVFVGATGGSLGTTSPALLVAVPLAIFLALAGLLYGWAILSDDTLR